MSVSEPGKIITPWAESGLKNTIPPTANPATGRAGFDQGFSAINMTAKEAGGIPPFGQDFNGIFYEITKILQYMQAGGQPTFDADFAAAIGGYPAGAILSSDDGMSLFRSVADGNATDPNLGGEGWTRPDLQIMELYRRSYAEAGYNVAGTFQAGFTYVNANDVGIDLATGKGYTGPAGPVAAGTNPASGGFVDRSAVVISIAETFRLDPIYGAAWAAGAIATDLKQWFTYGGTVWAPLSIPATLPASPSYSGWVQLASDGNFRPSQFGAAGDADINTTPTDDTAAFERALTYCASIGRNLIPDFGKPRYSVDSVAIPIGITRFRRFKFKARTAVEHLVYTKGPQFPGGSSGIRCDIYGNDGDCNDLALRFITLNGVSFSEVKRNKSTGHKVAADSTGIKVWFNCNNLDIEKNEIRQIQDPDAGVGSLNISCIQVSAETTSVYGGIDVAGSPTYPATTTVTDISIRGNKLYNGTHGIQVSGGQRIHIQKNRCDNQTHRNINLSPAVRLVTVSSNTLLNAGSSAVNAAWGCKRIKVHNNTISSFNTSTIGPTGDDAAIQAYQDIEDIEITNNEIAGDWKYCVYLANYKKAQVIGNKFVDGGSLANIMLESAWFTTTPLPAAAPYSKQRPIAVNATTNSYMAEIALNEHGGSSAAIAITASNGKTCADISISNENIRGSGRSHYVHIYSESVALCDAAVSMIGVRGSALAGSSVSVNKYASSIGRSAFKVVSDVVGFEDSSIVHNVEPVSGAISAFYGPIIAVVSGTVTDITGGAVGQRITLRLASGVVITHNSAKIRLKGLSNATGASANDLLHLINISGIWFETGRSF